MTYNEGYDAILAVFKTAWDTTGFEAAYADVPAPEVPDGESWARATVDHLDGGQASLTGADSTKRWNRLGLVSIQIYSPIGDGGIAGRALAQTMVNAYQAAKVGVWFRNVRMVEVPKNQGAWKVFNVFADFEYDDVR